MKKELNIWQQIKIDISTIHRNHKKKIVVIYLILAFLLTIYYGTEVLPITLFSPWINYFLCLVLFYPEIILLWMTCKKLFEIDGWWFFLYLLILTTLGISEQFLQGITKFIQKNNSPPLILLLVGYLAGCLTIKLIGLLTPYLIIRQINKKNE